MSQSGSSNNSGSLPPQVALEYFTDSGSAVPALNILNVFGDGKITTNGSGNTITIDSSPAFTPNTQVNLFDDFLSVILNYLGTGTIYSAMSWSMPQNIFSIPVSEIGHWGTIQNVVTTSNVSLFAGIQGYSGQPPEIIETLEIGGGQITLNWVFKITALSTNLNEYTLRLGLGDTQANDQANGVYFQYTNSTNSGNWQYKCANASVTTTSNSSVAMTTGWHNAQITINAAGTSASFSVDGVSLGSAIITNLPTADVTPFIELKWGSGTIAAGTLIIDLFYATQTLTTPR